MRDRLKFLSVFCGIFAAISQARGSVIMSRNHLLVNTRVNSKATNGTTRTEGSSWATKRLLLSANMVPRFSWSGLATQRANRCRQKRALELNLDLSVVWL